MTKMEKRSDNLANVEQLRRSQHNPLFDALVDEFDNVFLERSVNVEYILDRLFVGDRAKLVRDKLFFPSTASDESKIYGPAALHDRFRKLGFVYLLIGKKGIGKTSLLQYLHKRILKKETAFDSSVFVYLDLKDMKADKGFIANLTERLYDEVFDYIKYEDSENEGVRKYITNPDFIREIDPNYRYIDNDAALTERLIEKRREAIRALFSWAKKVGREVVVLIDNVDDYSKESIKEMIDFLVHLKNRFGTKGLIAVRDYWNPASLGIDDQNICSLHVAPPDVFEIIKRRLSAVDRRAIKVLVGITYDGVTVSFGPDEIVAIFEEICRQLIEKHRAIHSEMLNLSNYSIREYLQNMYYFLHSPYLFSKPVFIEALEKRIKEIDPDFNSGKSRKLRFYDFIECLMGIHSLCYDSESRLFNLFYHQWEYPEGMCYKNTLVFLRILIALADNHVSQNMESVVLRLLAIGYDEEAVRDAINILLRNALIQSEEGIDERDVESMRISVKGLKYLNLVNEFTYLVFISDAVPMPSGFHVDLVRKFGNEEIPIVRGNLQLKFDSVEKLLKFLMNEEKAEERSCPKQFLQTLRNLKGDLGRDFLHKAKRTVTLVYENMNRSPGRITKRIAISIRSIYPDK